MPIPLSAPHGALPGAFDGPREESLDWRRYASGTAGARFFPPRYQVQATIWIQAGETRSGTSRGPIGANQLFESYAWVDLLKSYVVLDEVTRDLRLYLAPERGWASAFAGFTVADTYRPGRYQLVVDHAGRTFRLLGAGGEELQSGNVGDPVGGALGMRWAPNASMLPQGSKVAFRLRALRDAAKGLGSSLSVTMDPSGNFLRIGLTEEDGSP